MYAYIDLRPRKNSRKLRFFPEAEPTNSENALGLRHKRSLTLLNNNIYSSIHLAACNYTVLNISKIKTVKKHCCPNCVSQTGNVCAQRYTSDILFVLHVGLGNIGKAFPKQLGSFPERPEKREGARA